MHETFGPRPKLSQCIDTSEKAARLEEQVAANAVADQLMTDKQSERLGQISISFDAKAWSALALGQPHN